MVHVKKKKSGPQLMTGSKKHGNKDLSFLTSQVGWLWSGSALSHVVPHWDWHPVAHRGNFSIMYHDLVTFPSLPFPSLCLTSLLPTSASWDPLPINYLHSNPRFRVSFWENPIQPLSRSVLTPSSPQRISFRPLILECTTDVECSGYGEDGPGFGSQEGSLQVVWPWAH